MEAVPATGPEGDLDEPEIREPGVDWRRTYLACLAGAAVVTGAILLLGLAASAIDPTREPPSAALVAGALLLVPVLALLATLALAGAPPARALRVEIRPEGLVLDDGLDRREIPSEGILDLRGATLLLEGGERVRLAANLAPALRRFYRNLLADRIRRTGRTYRHETEAPRWPERLARGYLLGFLAVGLVAGLGLLLRAGGEGPLVALVIAAAVAVLFFRHAARRREDRVRAAALESVTLDVRGIEIAERDGEVSRIEWVEIEDVPPPRGTDAIVVETAETIHALPRSFHPTLARDLRAAWHALAPARGDGEPDGGDGDGEPDAS